MQYQAKIILDSVTPLGARLTTFELTYPRFIHSELMTHRDFSRNASSCLTGDTLVYFLKPSCLKRGELTISQKTTLHDLSKKWFFGDSKRRSMKSRIKNMYLRSLNLETGQFEFAHITDVFNQGVQEVYEVVLKNGYSIKCTTNQKIYTQNGWITLENLSLKKSPNGVISWDNNDVLVATNGFEITKEWILEQKELGKTVKEIAEEYNLNYKHLSAIKERYKIYFKKKEYSNENFIFKDKDWLMQQVSEGKFFTEIAKFCNTSQNKVKKTARKYGIRGNKYTRLNCEPWNKGKTYKQKEESLYNVRNAAKKRIKENSYKGYKSFNTSVTRFLQENRVYFLQKYNYKCAVSGRGDNLQLHHIDPVWNNKELAFDKDNIIVLNKDVHSFIHRNNLEHEFMNYFYGNKDLTAFLVDFQNTKIHYSEINKPVAPGNTLVVRYYGIQDIKYIGYEQTYDLEVSAPNHNYVANGIVVHNSRALPTQKIINTISEFPAMPVYWGQLQSGMQASQEIEDIELAQKIWLEARDQMIDVVKKLTGVVSVNKDTGEICFDDDVDATKINLHKQIANRILEPWMWITVICSSTDYDNFFALRRHTDAQPEIQKLANMMNDSYMESTPNILNHGDWHMPYIQNDELITLDIETRKKVSVARCARVSYLTHDGVRSIEKDLELYDRLVNGSGTGHWSPFEHVAMALGYLKSSGNYVGFEQYRKLFSEEYRGRNQRS